MLNKLIAVLGVPLIYGTGIYWLVYLVAGKYRGLQQGFGLTVRQLLAWAAALAIAFLVGIFANDRTDMKPDKDQVTSVALFSLLMIFGIIVAMFIVNNLIEYLIGADTIIDDGIAIYVGWCVYATILGSIADKSSKLGGTFLGSAMTFSYKPSKFGLVVVGSLFGAGVCYALVAVYYGLHHKLGLAAAGLGLMLGFAVSATVCLYGEDKDYWMPETRNTLDHERW
jgi:hypothetical protein